MIRIHKRYKNICIHTANQPIRITDQVILYIATLMRFKSCSTILREILLKNFLFSNVPVNEPEPQGKKKI
jgi:hypothetical protein